MMNVLIVMDSKEKVINNVGNVEKEMVGIIQQDKRRRKKEMKKEIGDLLNEDDDKILTLGEKARNEPSPENLGKLKMGLDDYREKYGVNFNMYKFVWYKRK